MDNHFFSHNRKQLQEKLQSGESIVIFSNTLKQKCGDQSYPFHQNADFFYFSGINQENSVLLIHPSHPDIHLREVLFISKPNEKTALWLGHKLTDEEATLQSGITTIHWMEELDKQMPLIIGSSARIYVNEILGYNEHFEKINLASAKIKSIFPNREILSLEPFSTGIRIIKEYDELMMIQKAVNISQKAFMNVLKTIKPNQFEYEIEAEIMYGFLNKGSRGAAFPTIVASGKNACVLHYTNNNQRLKDGDMVLIDFGAEYNNYAADCSRTIPVNGKFNKRQRELYEAVLLFHNEAIKLMKPGICIEEINRRIVLLMQETHIRLGLYTQEDIDKQEKEFQLCRKYFMHSVSHFLGLEVHDVGSKSTTLAPGMVLTCEPGIYIQEENIGIRIENDILITENEAVNLTQEIPFEINELEKLMQKNQ